MKKILLVEDDPLLIDIYGTKLKEAEFDVQVAENGEVVQGKIESFMPDLVILDIVLPREDGWAVLQTVRKNEAWKNIKVIMLSNLSQKEDFERARDLGANLYLVKAHYTPSQVVEEIKKLLV